MTERVLSVRLRAITDAYERGMDRAAVATERMAGRVSRVSGFADQASSVGSKMTMGLTLPLAAIGTVAAKSAIDFESSFAGVTKTVNGTQQELAGLRQGIIDMANSTPASREEIAGIAEAAGQLGIQTDSVLSFTKTIIDLGNSTNLAGEEGASMLAQFANITQMPQGEFSNLGSAITAVGNAGASTEADIAELALRLAGAGSQVNMTAAEIVGLASGLADLGIPAEMGGSAVSRVMLDMQAAVIDGGKTLEGFAEVAGMSSEKFAGLFKKNASQAFVAFTEGLGKVKEAGGSTKSTLENLGLADTRIIDVMNRVSGAGGGIARSIDLSSKAFKENTALTDEASKRYATTESRLQMAANRASDFARKTGEALVPALLAVVGVLDPVVTGLGGVAEAAARAPKPIQMVGGSILGIALASGPAIWALGKLAALYGPVVSGFQKMIGAVQGFQLQLHLASMSGLSTGQALLQMIGPQAAIIAGLAAIAAGIYAMKRAEDDAAKSHKSAGDAAMQLGKSAGLTLRDIDNMGDSAENATGKVEAFRQKNQDAIATLKALSSTTDQQAYLVQVGFELVQRGATAEQAMQQVQKLADAAGVDVPVTLTVENIGDFENQITGVVAAARRIGNVDAIFNWSGAKKELEGLGDAAAGAWNQDDVAGYIAILGSAESQMGDNLSAINILADEGMKSLGEGFGFSLDKGQNLVDVLDQLRSGATTATPEQVAVADAIWKTADAMKGGVTAANLSAAALQFQGLSASETKDKVAAAGVSVDNFSDSTGEAEQTTTDFADVLDKMAATAAMSTLDLDAAAAAAEAYAQSIERSTNVDDTLGAGLGAGRAAQAFREGMTGQKRLQDAADETKKKTKDAASAVDELADAAAGLDPKMTAAGIATGSLAAAADAFRQAMEDSSWVDDQAESALGLGDAYRAFRKSMRALPDDLDMTAMSMGKLSKRQAQAVRDLMALGQASSDYLATMLEMGRGEGEVRDEASRMRGEYEAQLRQLGLNEEQIAKYIDMLGLTPSKVETAIKLSGEEAARFQLDAYLQLLQGKIPDEIATSVIGKIDSGDIKGAASQLSNWAKTNPVKIDVSPNVDDSGFADKVAEIQDSLWSLPKDFDPLTAALGGYDDAAMSALEAVQKLGDGYQTYIGKLIAGDTPDDEVKRQTDVIREEFKKQLADYGIVGDAADKYVELVGLSKPQIDTAITVSGEAEAMKTIETFMQNVDLLSAPREIQVEVAKAQLEGRLGDAATLIKTWWNDSRDGVIDNPLVAQILGDTTSGETSLQTFRDYVATHPPDPVPITADAGPARSGMDILQGLIPTFGGAVPIAADDSEARGQAWDLATDVQKLRPEITIEARLGPSWDSTFDKISERYQGGPGYGTGAGGSRPTSGIDPNPGGGVDGNIWTPYALGGDFAAGTKALVGEEGPELVEFRAAGTVRPADQTAKMMARRAQVASAMNRYATSHAAAGYSDAFTTQPGGSGMTDARIVAAITDLQAEIARLETGINIAELVMPTPEPSRAAANLLQAATTTARAARRG